MIKKNDIFLPTLSDFDKISPSDRTSFSDCKKQFFFKMVNQLIKIGRFFVITEAEKTFLYLYVQHLKDASQQVKTRLLWYFQNC